MFFIILHDHDTGNEIMVNPEAIETIDGSQLNFRNYAYMVEESYEEIKSALSEEPCRIQILGRWSSK